ncbi:MAG: GCN5-related N-acetyltransferase [Frankiales bacterium]|nr:GCN5-related N-acetyltransferase [Frankiales bacterium]
MLTPASGLTSTALQAIVDLEQRVVAHDGGRLKLEHGVLAERSGDEVEDLLWWDGDRLVGFLGSYAFGPPDLELAGMVDPSHRRRGIGSELLSEGLRLSARRGYARALLVATSAGRDFALAKGGVLSHSEHFLVLGETPVGAPVEPAVTCRQAELSDVEEIEALLTRAFGQPARDVAGRLTTSQEQTLVVERDGTTVGTVRLSRFEGVAAVYGFAVDPCVQGQGIGRGVLARWCRQLRDEGYERVTLEVAVDNESALGLYLSTGFERSATENYWEFAL